MKILVIGAGAWGTALAMNAAARHEVRLWARDSAQAAQMQAARENTRYLPGIPFPPALQVVAGDVTAHGIRLTAGDALGFVDEEGELAIHADAGEGNEAELLLFDLPR